MRANATTAGSLHWPATPAHGAGQFQSTLQALEPAAFCRILATELANDLPLPGADRATSDVNGPTVATGSWATDGPIRTLASGAWQLAELLATTSPSSPPSAPPQTPAMTAAEPGTEAGDRETAAAATLNTHLPAWVQQLATSAAARYGVPAGLVMSVIAEESGGNPDVVSRAGAVGLMQLLPATAAALGVTDVRDPAANVDAGTRYLAQLLQQFGGDAALALAAYNAGPGAVQQAHGIPPYTETQHYVRAVLARWQAGQAETGTNGGGWSA